MSDDYTYGYTIPLPPFGPVRITPCGPRQITATSDLVEVPGYPPFYVHKLVPTNAPGYYQLTGVPTQFATLAEAVLAQLSPLTPYPGDAP